MQAHRQSISLGNAKGMIGARFTTCWLCVQAVSWPIWQAPLCPSMQAMQQDKCTLVDLNLLAVAGQVARCPLG